MDVCGSPSRTPPSDHFGSMFILLRFATVALVSTILFAGCGGGGAVGGADRQPVYPVTGTIKRSGAPVPDATVIFSPRGKQKEAIGRTDSEGRFTLTTYDVGDGAAAGDYLVVVLKESPVAAAPVMHGPSFDPNKPGTNPAGSATTASRSILPVKYASPTSTDLRATVKAEGPNEFPFDLK